MIGTSNARLEVGAFVVNIGAHQWDVLDGHVSFSHPIGTTPYGAHYRDPYDVIARFREVRFIKSPALIEELRHLTFLAGKAGTKVKFTPDVADTGTFWWLDWPLRVDFERETDWSGEITVRLQEQSPGA